VVYVQHCIPSNLNRMIILCLFNPNLLVTTTNYNENLGYITTLAFCYNVSEPLVSPGKSELRRLEPTTQCS